MTFVVQTSFNNSFYSGTSGIVLPVSKTLYPDEFKEKSRLEYYASIFNSIEINSSFYKLPKTSTIIRWREAVPEYFQFTFKLPKTVSHSKGLHFNDGEIERFLQTINNVGKKKACILVQLPPLLKLDKIKQLQKLLKTLDKANKQGAWKVAVEFRNKIWYNDEIFELLQKYNCSLVQQDLPASATPYKEPITDVGYLRFHGIEKGYRGSYNDKLLLEYAQHIKQWLHEGKCVYTYFNNTLGDAFNNLHTLKRFVSSL